MSLVVVVDHPAPFDWFPKAAFREEFSGSRGPLEDGDDVFRDVPVGAVAAGIGDRVEVYEGGPVSFSFGVEEEDLVAGVEVGVDAYPGESHHVSRMCWRIKRKWFAFLTMTFHSLAARQHAAKAPSSSYVEPQK